MDIIFVRGLEIETVIGVYDWEREIRQKIVLDLEMGWAIRAAADSDDLANALDYKAVSDRIIEFVSTSDFFLIETLAERIARIVLDEFNVPWLRLSLTKPAAVPAAQRGVGLVIERSRDSQ